MYFQVDVAARVRRAVAPHTRRPARERGRARRRRRAQAQPGRLRALEGGEARRARVGLAVGPGPARLAHRVLGDVAADPRRRVRHPRRRQRPRVPAPRERDRASRRRRPRVRALLDAQRHAQRRRREDVEVARQLHDARRRARPATTRARSACSCCRRTTAGRWRSATKELGDAEKDVEGLDALLRRARAANLPDGRPRRARRVPRRDGRRLRHARRDRGASDAASRRQHRARREPCRRRRAARRDRSCARRARSGSRCPTPTTTWPSDVDRARSRQREEARERQGLGRSRPHPGRAAGARHRSSRTRRTARSGARSDAGIESRPGRDGGLGRRAGRGPASGARAAARREAPGASCLGVELGPRRRRARRDPRAGGRRARRSSPADRIDAMARSDAHAGSRRDARRRCPPPTSTSCCGAHDAFLVALDGVTDPRNLGAVARVAETAGATGLVLPRHRSAHVTPAVAKAAAGAIEYLPIALVAASRPRSNGRGGPECWTVGPRRARRPSLFDLELADQPLVLVLGSEGRGLARLTRDALRRAGVDPDAWVDRVTATSRPRPRSRATRSPGAARRHACEVAKRHYDRDVAGLAQSAEQLTCNQQVVGSIPTPGSGSGSFALLRTACRECLYSTRVTVRIVR